MIIISVEQQWAATLHSAKQPTNVSVAALTKECQHCSTSALLVPPCCVMLHYCAFSSKNDQKTAKNCSSAA
jgi:hypothetical protein